MPLKQKEEFYTNGKKKEKKEGNYQVLDTRVCEVYYKNAQHKKYINVV